MQIPYPRDRWIVGLVDLATSPLGWSRRPSQRVAERILLMRLERIGDLLMTREAIALVRERSPRATLHLVVGSWNRDLAQMIPDIDDVEILDVPWLARDGPGASWPALVARARCWRGRYDLAINFEPDIRSNFLAWLGGARRRVGFWTGGGRAFLTDAVAYDPARHVSINASGLVSFALPGSSRSPAESDRPVARPLVLPPPAIARAAQILAPARGRAIGVHASGGRESKQWHLDRFADVARRLSRDFEATIVLTGGPSDRPIVDRIRRELGDARVIDAAGALDLPTLAALLARLDVLVTGDTGPMHLAAAVGTPVVALFGPSDPRRYGPLATRQRVLRIDLPCSPCGRVRMPPARCRGHVPDCLDGIRVETVVAAAAELLAEGR